MFLQCMKHSERQEEDMGYRHVLDATKVERIYVLVSTCLNMVVIVDVLLVVQSTISIFGETCTDVQHSCYISCSIFLSINLCWIQ